MWVRFLTDIGGISWWLFIRLGRTELDIELAKENTVRNMLVIIAIVFIGAFISVNFL